MAVGNPAFTPCSLQRPSPAWSAPAPVTGHQGSVKADGEAADTHPDPAAM